MFAVPGWNVSAPLKAETQAPKAANANSKKRKRSHGKKSGANATELVTENNVADMWARVVEGSGEGGEAEKKQGAGEQKEGKQKKKKPRRESDAAGEETPKTSDGKAEKKDDAPVEKGRMKKQKNSSSAAAPVVSAPTPAPLPPVNTKLTPLQAKMREKLASARFRHLNQTLYTAPSQHSLKLIEEDPHIFTEYHAGFRQQVAVWPENPVDTFVALVKARGKVRESWRDKRGRRDKGGRKSGGGGDDDSDAEQQADAKTKLKPLPRTHGTCVLADLGCGDAALSAQLQASLRKLHLQIHSFDLAAPTPLVTKADVANLPLADNSVDVALFCLALMGTNWTDFIDEAYRVLRWKGELWVAEIKSRFGRVGAAKTKKPGDAVAHSVGKRQKNKKAAKKGGDGEDDDAEPDDETLAVHVDGAQSTRQETDVSAFVDVLRKRGFVLDAEPGRDPMQQAVDLHNKMFVRMSFVKAASPVKGKNVRSKDGGGDAEVKGGGGGGATWKSKAKKGGKFVDVEEEGDGDEAGVLKPCVYKLR